MNTTSRALKKERKFRPGDHPPRHRAEYVGYGSFERHRLLKLWWDSNRSQFKDARVLHFVPKDPVKKLAVELPNESFDLVICSDVLEHVNDKRILCELHRILSKNGALVTMVQTIDGGEKAYEDAATNNPKPGRVNFGGADHTTIYCADFRKRALSAGFSVEEFTAGAPNSTQCGRLPGDKVFVCRK
jgi:SAM-dependent methyltransferase